MLALGTGQEGHPNVGAEGKENRMQHRNVIFEQEISSKLSQKGGKT